MTGRLHKGDEDRRRWKIIDASRSADAGMLPQLLARFDLESYENKRHIVRALGRIGGPKAEEKLVDILGSEKGPILGEVAQALGRLGTRRAAPALKTLMNHESEWVRQNARFALSRLGGDH
ncbi:HEAT repeat domain-containing protein [Paludisphaera soli]|uniref:HEAT repeat domain-containing protein n=1 Tax=Paludisphaera soli TaxID=2712865 RepID=UPI0013EAE5FD|nr:HEAT repeat domain-containing protein [Paludisphaera soli]